MRRFILRKKVAATETNDTHFMYYVNSEYPQLPQLPELNMILAEPEHIFSKNLTDARVFDSEDYEFKMAWADGLKDDIEIVRYEMNIKEIILRSISFALQIFIVLPLYFIQLCICCPIWVISNFAYDNYKEYILPIEVLEKATTGLQSPGFLKIWVLFITPFIQVFVMFYKDGIRQTKF